MNDGSRFSVFWSNILRTTTLSLNGPYRCQYGSSSEAIRPMAVTRPQVMPMRERGPLKRVGLAVGALLVRTMSYDFFYKRSLPRLLLTLGGGSVCEAMHSLCRISLPRRIWSLKACVVDSWTARLPLRFILNVGSLQYRSTVYPQFLNYLYTNYIHLKHVHNDGGMFFI